MGKKRSMQRGRPPVQRQRLHAPGLPSSSALAPQHRHVLDHVRDAPQETDPLTVELMVGRALTEAAFKDTSTPTFDEVPSGMMIMVDRDDPHKPGLTDPMAIRFDASTEHGLWTGLIEAAVAIPSRRSLALLRALTVILPEPGIAALAAEAAGALAATGLPQPPWADALATLEPGPCWIARLDAGYLSVLTSYTYRDRVHGLSILVDSGMGGVAKNAFATVKIDEALARSSELAPASPVEAHQVIAEAYDLTYARRDLPVDPDVHHLRLAVLRRVRASGA